MKIVLSWSLSSEYLLIYSCKRFHLNENRSQLKFIDWESFSLEVYPLRIVLTWSLSTENRSHYCSGTPAEFMKNFSLTVSAFIVKTFTKGSKNTKLFGNVNAYKFNIFIILWKFSQNVEHFFHDLKSCASSTLQTLSKWKFSQVLALSFVKKITMKALTMWKNSQMKIFNCEKFHKFW